MEVDIAKAQVDKASSECQWNGVSDIGADDVSAPECRVENHEDGCTNSASADRRECNEYAEQDAHDDSCGWSESTQVAGVAGRRKGLNACSHEDNDGSHDQHDAEGVFQQVAVVFSVIEEHMKKGAGN